ncbi:hypothetical protein FJ651_09325 [Paucihalobacter ruber]|uniref:LTXXQ motif family protein n=1 Tax=Paucihalobacter ruber TaxID=2567861 RepID=A0A506PIU1_9FLAO|nr:hypothetical protein [Paucihalobacter ruber]TPV33285.1 hypothetical protein FJ651_09325 [Paucihalobacter ruber]
MQSLILAIFILISFSLAGQNHEITKEQKIQVEASIKKHFEKLELSEQQKPKFEAIIKRYAIQFIHLQESNQGRLSKYKTYKALSKKRNEEIQTILSISQFEKYVTLQKELQQKMMNKKMN